MQIYEGYTYENDHLPTLDSLSYALWKYNADCRTAKQYSQEGFILAGTLIQGMPKDKESTIEALLSLQDHRPELATLVDRRIAEIRNFYKATEPAITKYLADHYFRLGNLTAYCMAYEQVEEGTARKIADDVLKGARDDPDYLDTKGFVIMRFATTLAELDQAIALFTESLNSPEADQGAKELSQHHLSLAWDIMKRLTP